jgi:two-component system response regulator FlrC
VARPGAPAPAVPAYVPPPPAMMEVPQLAPQIPQAIPVEEDGGLQSGGKKADSIKDWERELILETLASVGGSRKLAVEKLGISERTLRHKLRQYRLAGYLNE